MGTFIINIFYKSIFWVALVMKMICEYAFFAGFSQVTVRISRRITISAAACKAAAVLHVNDRKKKTHSRRVPWLCFLLLL